VNRADKEDVNQDKANLKRSVVVRMVRKIGAEMRIGIIPLGEITNVSHASIEPHI
jgi:hypothetical protein